jgi:hypothetical protein
MSKIIKHAKKNKKYIIQNTKSESNKLNWTPKQKQILKLVSKQVQIQEQTIKTET